MSCLSGSLKTVWKHIQPRILLAFSGQRATQVEEPDSQVDLNLGSSGPAFVGESFMVPVTVTSKGHCLFW